MTITLHLPADVEHKLESLATQNGQNLETFIHHLLTVVSGDTTAQEVEHENASETPIIVNEGGIHVVYAEATGNLDEILHRVREERMDHIGAFRKS